MSKKDYIAIAQVISEQPDTPEVRAIAEGMARYFERDNHLFNRSRFLAACGVLL
jgi:hypothetical protein